MSFQCDLKGTFFDLKTEGFAIEDVRNEVLDFLKNHLSDWFEEVTRDKTRVVPFLSEDKLFIFVHGSWTDECKNIWFVVRAIPTISQRSGHIRDDNRIYFDLRLLKEIYRVHVTSPFQQVSWNYRQTSNVGKIVPQNCETIRTISMVPMTRQAVLATHKSWSAPPLPFEVAVSCNDKVQDYINSSSTAASLGDKKTRPFDSNCLPTRLGGKGEAAIKKWFLPKFSTDVENTEKDVAIVLVTNDPDDECIKRIQNNPKIVGMCVRQIYGSTKEKFHHHVGFIVKERGEVQDSVRETFLETFFEALSDGKSLYDAFAMAKSSAKCVSSKFTQDWKQFEIEIHAYPKKWAHIFEA
jgi:hypothetical protein